jgi:hypothetical protein
MKDYHSIEYRNSVEHPLDNTGRLRPSPIVLSLLDRTSFESPFTTSPLLSLTIHLYVIRQFFMGDTMVVADSRRNGRRGTITPAAPSSIRDGARVASRSTGSRSSRSYSGGYRHAAIQELRQPQLEEEEKQEEPCERYC